MGVVIVGAGLGGGDPVDDIDPRVPGLAVTGMGTVPGVGIPMVHLSGRLAALRVNALRR